MDQQRSHLKLSRRKFLGLSAAAGVSAAGGYTLYDTAPWMDYSGQAAQTWAPVQTGLPVPDQMRELVRAATLAANGHNAQPWKFAIRDGAIEIHPDAARRLAVVDPHDRELWISLGCALENLLTAARAAGYTPEVAYPASEDVVRVQLHTDAPQIDPAFEAIPRRQNVRSDYDGQPVPTADLDMLQALPLEPEIDIHLITGQPRIETLVEVIHAGTLAQYGSDPFIDELVDWLRFNKREALDHLDGLFTGATGNPQVPRWVGKLFVTRMNPQDQADADSAKMRSASGAVVIASRSDDKVAWVRTGQVYERLALALTTREIHSAFLNQPVEVAEVRAQLQTALGSGAALPQLLLRFGYGQAMPRALRRPVEDVLL
jgi:hypothetical protein